METVMAECHRHHGLHQRARKSINFVGVCRGVQWHPAHGRENGDEAGLHVDFSHRFPVYGEVGALRLSHRLVAAPYGVEPPALVPIEIGCLAIVENAPKAAKWAWLDDVL